MATTYNNFSDSTPDIKVNVGNTFGFDADFEVPAFADSNEYVPAVDEAYCFDRSTTLSILAGFSIIDVSWFKVCMALENQLILNKLQPV